MTETKHDATKLAGMSDEAINLALRPLLKIPLVAIAAILALESEATSG